MANGALIFLVIIILLVVTVAWTAYGRRGSRSDISSHAKQDASTPGADGPSEADHDHAERNPGTFGTR